MLHLVTYVTNPVLVLDNLIKKTESFFYFNLSVVVFIRLTFL